MTKKMQPTKDRFETAIDLPAKRLPAVVKQELANAPSSTALQRAKEALAECLTYDQAKEIADEAKAVARYAAEKKDAEELLRMARQIQVRAYRRMGEILQKYGGRFHPMSPETIALRIAEMNEGQFEDALARDQKGLGPHEFAKIHVPRPPPVYASDPESVARRQRRLQRQMGNADANRTRWALKSFHDFSKSITPSDAAAVFSRAELIDLRDEIVKCQEWLDGFERFLPKARR